jgi:hypothetical protein
MSYGAAAALQAAVYGRLQTDPALEALVGQAVFDAMPGGPVPPIYVAIGPEVARDRSDMTGRSAEHEFTVSVVTDTAGFQAAKQAAGVVSDALIDAPLTLARGHLVRLDFWRAQAARVGSGNVRRITLTFRAFVADD